MTRVLCVAALMYVVGGCATTQIYPRKTLSINWQRLADEAGGTCQRCAITQREVRLAVDTLTHALRPLNMHVVL